MSEAEVRAKADAEWLQRQIEASDRYYERRARQYEESVTACASLLLEIAKGIKP